MARIVLDGIRHSYAAQPAKDGDWALKRLDLAWADGGAYALLGPSGCGKTTLLNIISGLVRPSEGRILFDGLDLTDVPTDQRRIAQVFQFPVVYDTMTVRENLAFPLRNRGLAKPEIAARVAEIAAMLELTPMLDKRAAGLTADSQQKISLGRGLVRSDVNAILFDEPLTVIDPHLKWLLRSKLKELHHRIRRTMIYVTHDQTEALTFADAVVVMNEGQVVQIGTPVELFERPKHTFVGHFIGSPGMNVLPCELAHGAVRFQGIDLPLPFAPAGDLANRRLEIGVRPEFVALAEDGIPVRIQRVSNNGRHRIVESRCGDSLIRFLVAEGVPIPAESAHLRFDPGFTGLYADGWLVDGAQQ